MLPFCPFEKLLQYLNSKPCLIDQIGDKHLFCTHTRRSPQRGDIYWNRHHLRASGLIIPLRGAISILHLSEIATAVIFCSDPFLTNKCTFTGKNPPGSLGHLSQKMSGSNRYYIECYCI